MFMHNEDERHTNRQLMIFGVSYLGIWRTMSLDANLDPVVLDVEERNQVVIQPMNSGSFEEIF